MCGADPWLWPGEGSTQQAEAGHGKPRSSSWLCKTRLPLHIMLKQLLSMALESLFLVGKHVAVLCTPTPQEAKLGSVQLSATERKKEKSVQLRDGERNRSRVIFDASLKACLKIESEPFPSN